jgi:formylglycine-generating enzyme required for sulfatase activity
MDWEVAVDAHWVDAHEVTAGEQHGALAGGEYVEIEVATNEGVELLGPGTYTGTVTFQNGTTGSVQMRLLTLIIESPIRIVPDGLEAEVFEGYWKGPFETPSVTREFTLYNDSGSDLSYTVSATQPWLVVEPVDGPEDLSGTLDAFGAVGFECSVGPIAETLGVGRHEGALRFSFIDTSNGNVSGSTDRSVVLMIEEPIAVFEPADPWEVGPNLDPDAPDALAAQSYTISNRAADVIEVSVLADQDWIDLDATFLQVFPGTDQERTVTASLNPNALALPDGVYESSITFEDTITGAILCRSVVLNIEEDVSLRPLNGLVAAGVVGAAANPSFKVFTLTNVARDGGGELLWEAYVCSQEAQWVLIDGAFASGGSLQDGESRTVIVSIDAVATGALEDGVHTADVCFRVVPDGEEHVRPVSLRLSVPTRSVADGVVPAESMQPEGPDYAYRVAQFHTTNAEYVAFLNDAILHPTDERGQHVYVDASNGDVYVNTSTTGEIGVDDGRRTVKLFSPSISGQIEYAGGAYGVASAADDYADHPVTGVSWYGAVKYCNWLTIDQGMPASERCYTEDVSTEPAGWHPVSTTGTDWLNRDLLDAERFRLVTECEGYRLPMDNGHNNLSSALDSADGFNEWYKAAAWSDLLDQNTTYGFGRSSITGQDANFRGSGDPWDEGTTPAGYFDGTDHGGTFETNPLGNANAFGLFDLTGNVFHWMQGRYNAHPDSIDFRTIRGGSWGDSFDSPDLRNDRRTFIPADATSAIVGFRVVRSLAGPDGDVDGDGDVDVVDFAASRICLNGPEVGYVPGCASLDLDDDVDVDLRDVGAFQLIFAGAR